MCRPIGPTARRGVRLKDLAIPAAIRDSRRFARAAAVVADAFWGMIPRGNCSNERHAWSTIDPPREVDCVCRHSRSRPVRSPHDASSRLRPALGSPLRNHRRTRHPRRRGDGVRPVRRSERGQLLPRAAKALLRRRVLRDAVCAIDPACCSTAWDAFCVNAASRLCETCEPTPLAIVAFGTARILPGGLLVDPGVLRGSRLGRPDRRSWRTWLAPSVRWTAPRSEPFEGVGRRTRRPRLGGAGGASRAVIRGVGTSRASWNDPSPREAAPRPTKRWRGGTTARPPTGGG